MHHPELLLRSVNRLFFENTDDNAYASLFLATYNDQFRRQRSANCGHLAGLFLRTDGSIKRLDPTATVLGLFDQWNCSVVECDVGPGDTLTFYTDVITEARNLAGKEFEEHWLIEALRKSRKLSSDASLKAGLSEVELFSHQRQHDDVTLIIAKGRPDR